MSEPTHKARDAHTRSSTFQFGTTGVQLAIVRRMEDDLIEEIARAEAEGCGANINHRVAWRVLATPLDTDNAQCWSEEIFSLL